MFEFLKKRSEKKEGAKPVVNNVPKADNKPAGKMNIKIEPPAPVKISAVKPATPGEASQPAEKDSNVFTDLFPTEDKTKTDDTLVSSLNASTQTKSILKSKKGDEDLLLYKKPTLGANLLKFTVLLILLISSYFYTQLSPTFELLGENPVQERAAAYDRVVEQQSKLNKQNYVLAKYALDDFLYTADSYLHKRALSLSDLTPQKEKAALDKEFPTLRSKMRENLLLANEKLSYKIVPDALPAHPDEGSNHAQEFKKSLTATTKSISKNDLVEISFTKENSSIDGNLISLKLRITQKKSIICPIQGRGVLNIV